MDQLKSGQEGPVDPVVVEMCGTLAEATTTTNRAASRAALQQIALRMGQLPLVDGKVAPGEERFSAHSGMMFTRGRRVHMGWVTYRRLADAAAAVVAWLSGKGCADFKYELETGIGGGAEPE